MEKWREDAQPEGPEAAAATKELPESNRHRDLEPATAKRDTETVVIETAVIEDARPDTGGSAPDGKTQILRDVSRFAERRPADRGAKNDDFDDSGAKARSDADVPADRATPAGPKNPWDAVTSRGLRDRAGARPSSAPKPPTDAGREPAPGKAAAASPVAGRPAAANPAAANPAAEKSAAASSVAGKSAPAKPAAAKPAAASSDSLEPRAGSGLSDDSAPAGSPRTASDSGDSDRTTALLIKPRPGREAGGSAGGPRRLPDDVVRSPREGAARATAGPASGAATAGPASRPFAAPLDLPVRDPWQEEDGEARDGEVRHDPHEVTVQLDAVQFADGVLRRTPGRGQGGSDGPSDGPVFVDESGRRGRRYRRIGMAVGLACAGYAVVIGATLMSGNSNAPWLPVPGQKEEQPAGKVETTPGPAESAATPGSGTSLEPGAGPSAGDVTLPSPGASVAAPGATAVEDQPGEADDPAATPTRNTPKPDPGDDDPTPTQPAEPPAETPAEPTPTDDPAPEPTETTGGGDGAGTDNVAGAPAAPVVVADGPAAQPDSSPAPAAPAAPSPEHLL
ncbi:hypothetical protein [Streptomyces sp. NPDC052012]|uniref:hypothetical protein n=1 Tax=Streptomyces sp. NPDC052012 TaxID=3155051 RepID=UPI003450B4D0